MSTLDVARTELALAVLYLNKAEARDKICRAIHYGSKFVSNGEPGTAQNVDNLARKVFRLLKLLPSPVKAKASRTKYGFFPYDRPEAGVLSRARLGTSARIRTFNLMRFVK